LGTALQTIIMRRNAHRLELSQGSRFESRLVVV
jgi:hypothetical protein